MAIVTLVTVVAPARAQKVSTSRGVSTLRQTHRSWHRPCS
jgi:hypothetical protein